MVTRLLAALLGAALACVGTVSTLDAHPLHTTLTEVTINPSTNAVRATIRVFSDDLTSAMSRGRRNVTSDADVSAYLAAAFSIADKSGRAISLRGCGVRRSGDLLWVCVEGSGSAELSLRNAVLCDVFPDQVNIVQVARNAEKRTILFTRGDAGKRL